MFALKPINSAVALFSLIICSMNTAQAGDKNVILTLYLNSKIPISGQLTFKYGMRYGGTGRMGKSAEILKRYSVIMKKAKRQRWALSSVKIRLNLATLPKNRPVDGEVLFSLQKKARKYQNFVVAKLWLRKCGHKLCSPSYKIHLPLASYGIDGIFNTCVQSRDRATSEESIARVYSICQKAFFNGKTTKKNKLLAGSGWQDASAKLVNSYDHKYGRLKNGSKYRLDSDSRKSLRRFRRDNRFDDDEYFRKLTRTDARFTERWKKAKKKDDATRRRASGMAPLKSNSNLKGRFGS